MEEGEAGILRMENTMVARLRGREEREEHFINGEVSFWC